MELQKKPTSSAAKTTSVSKPAPTAKKDFSLANFKKNINNKEEPDKEVFWFKMSEAWQKETGLPGIAKGYITLFRGFSNTGKSTALCEALVAAQKAGVLPIIIDTENNLSRERLKLMGFDWDNGFYIEIDNQYLLEEIGMKKKKDYKPEEGTIEDMAECINFFINKQEAGELPYDLFFAVDSIGTLDCEQVAKARVNDSTQNNMWNAGAYEKSFKGVNNYRIPNSRKVSKTYTNTMACVQKIWLQANPVGQPTIKHKGGDAFLYSARLIFHHGGKGTASVKQISAVSKGMEITFGTEAAIETNKNQVGGVLGGITVSGKLVSTPHGFIQATKESVDLYKKNNLDYFRSILGSDVNLTDIETREDIVNMSDDDAKAMFREM
jgi:hypothetical protein